MAYKPANPILTTVLILLLIPLWLAWLPAPAAAYYYDIRAYIDSVSDLVIKDDTVQWHNISCWAPGKWLYPEHNEPTTIATNLNLVPVNWYPDWASAIEDDVWSSIYSGLTPALAHIPQHVTLTKVQARHDIYITQYPSAANDYTLIVRFDDGLPGGADWYEARLELTPATPVPVTLLLMGSE